MFKFLTQMANGQSQFADYADIQIFLRKEILESLKNSITNINNISSNKFSILFNEEKAYPSLATRTRYNQITCTEDNGVPSSYICIDNSYKREQIKKIVIDQNDLQVIKGYLKTFINYIRLSTAYSIKGSKRVLAKLQKKDAQLKEGQKLTSFQIVYEILQEKKLFILNDAQILKDLKIDLVETLKDASDFIALNKKFCHRSLRENHLINSFCISTKAAKEIENTVELLSGPNFISIGKNKLNKDVKVMVDITALFDNPTYDLKSLIPHTFTQRGEAIYYPDKTFNGLFPNGDILEKLKEVNYKNVQSIFY